MVVSSFKLTKVYKLAFEQAMAYGDIWNNQRISQRRKYSLIDQVRRSSRSVNANLGEAYRKKKYPTHFVSKITDCDAENTETGIWLDFSLSCNYLPPEKHSILTSGNEEIGRLLSHMINNPEMY